MLRITENGKTRNYIKGVLELLENQGEELREVVLWARGRSINKLITVVGIVKRKYPLLEQTNEISWEIERKETNLKDEERLHDEGVQEVEQNDCVTQRHKSVMKITLRRAAAV